MAEVKAVRVVYKNFTSDCKSLFSIAWGHL